MPRTLGQEDWLRLLDQDPLQAEKKYEALRLKLVKFFEWNNASSPEDLAQDVMFKAFKRIAEGQNIYAENPHSYFFGFARKVLQEAWKGHKFDELGPDHGTFIPSAEHMLDLKRCLENLPDEERKLIVLYQSEEPSSLCIRMGISIDNLRLRIHRIRRKLQDCCDGEVST